ncbi:MAG: CHASE3 domain-containing protein [Rhodospirillales bacterium]
MRNTILVKRVGTIWLGLGFAVLLAALVGVVWVAGRQSAAFVAVQKAQEVENDLYRLLSLMQDAETGQRGYLLTANPAYLAPYHSALAEFASRRGDLAGDAAADQALSPLMSRLLQLVDAKLGELRQTVADFDRGDVGAAMAAVRSDVGRRTMDQIRDVIETMLDHERRVLRRLTDEAAAARAWMQGGALTVVLLTVMLGFLALREVVALLRETSASRDQLQAFNRNLEALVAERTADLEAARRSEAAIGRRFRAVAESMPQLVWSAQPDGHYDYYNSRCYAYTGIRPEAVDRDAWLRVFHPDDLERTRESWRHALATGEPYEIEYRLRRADGDYRWFLGRAEAVRDESGRIERWLGTCTDIDAIKQAEQARELLSHELSHRIKNIFAVISSLIALSVRNYPAARAFGSTLRERIAALGRAHEFVRPHSDASRVEIGARTLANFLAFLFAPYATTGTQRVRFEGEDIDFNDRAATPLALLFHELATNAMKYGALSRPDGHVAVTGTREEALYRIRWREIDGPTVLQPPERNGFGTTLATASVRGQLGGTIEKRWLAEGLEVEVTIPLANLTA